MLSIRHWLLMVLPFALWGTAMAAMTPLVISGGPLLVACLRLLPAGVVILLALPSLGRHWAIASTDRIWFLVFTVVDACLFQMFLVKGLAYTGAGMGSVLIDSQPLLVALLARSLFGESINPVGWMGLMFGLVGIICLGAPPDLLRHWWLLGEQASGSSLLEQGEVWMLAAAIAMALGTVLSRYACRSSDPVAVTGWHMVLGSLPLLLWHSFDRTWPLWPDWTGFDWGLMAYASLFGSALAYGLFFWLVNREELTSFSTLAFLTPVFALAAGGVWLGERLQPLQWFGVALVLLSVLVVSQRRRLWEPVEVDSDVLPGEIG
ncbi:MAG: DMT family transporter [Cyanobacteriota bacterium]|nr:DMT family transporter [Cyanobacteriota bacterium]